MNDNTPITDSRKIESEARLWESWLDTLFSNIEEGEMITVFSITELLHEYPRLSCDSVFKALKKYGWSQYNGSHWGWTHRDFQPTAATRQIDFVSLANKCKIGKTKKQEIKIKLKGINYDIE